MGDVCTTSTILSVSIPEFFGGKLDELVDTFGVSDGHIDYQAFVKIMMTKHR